MFAIAHMYGVEYRRGLEGGALMEKIPKIESLMLVVILAAGTVARSGLLKSRCWVDGQRFRPRL